MKKMNSGVKESAVAALPRKKSFLGGKSAVVLFFVAVWALFALFERPFLFRVNEMSLFLYNDIFFDGMVSVPAGFLSYLGAFMVQFFYWPVVGAALYVLSLAVVYKLTKRVFDIPDRLSLVALLPVVALIATNTELGYWIFYLKLPGYWYVAVIGTIVSLLAMWLFKSVGNLLRLLVVVAWLFVGYPLFGLYAIVSGVLMGVFAVAEALREKRGLPWAAVSLLLAVVLAYAVPHVYYNMYAAIATEYMYTVGVPAYQWVPEFLRNAEHETPSYWHSIYTYWVPFMVLLLSYLLICLLFTFKKEQLAKCGGKCAAVTSALLAVPALVFMWLFWYSDGNFRIENKQNLAMWQQDWESVAAYAKDTEKPTRQIVMNKNLALMKLGRAGQEMFAYPDGSSEILAPMGVHLTQTGGKMMYFQYGKFNFCYRWCVEDAVEYGWRVEYLKHAARCMLLQGDYKLASRYVTILKSTLFYNDWACELERFIENPELIEKEPEFSMPLQMKEYPDELAVDDSFVEVFLTKNLMNLTPESSPLSVEAALITSLIRKDVKHFWYIFDQYLKKCNPKVLPKHYQEALLLFLNLDKGQTVQVGSGFIDKYISLGTKHKFDAFIRRTTAHKGKTEAEMEPFFKDDFGDTYFYFYFFVRKIKTN